MFSAFAKSEAGFTLTELLVALGLTGLVLLIVVTGSMFVQKYVQDWSDRDKVMEELVFMSRDIGPQVERSRHLTMKADSLTLVRSDGSLVTYELRSNLLYKNGIPMTRAGLKVDDFRLLPLSLPVDTLSDTLVAEAFTTGLYTLHTAVSDNRGNRDSLQVVLRNDHECLKNQQR